MENEILLKLYNAYYKQIYLYLLSLSHSREIAEDLTQETFLKGMLTLDSSHKNPRAWLFTVARNLFIDHYRKSISKAGAELEDVAIEDDALDNLIADERKRALYLALQGLDRAKREVLQLQYFMGMSQNDIARLMHITPENVRVLAHRGRRELRKRLEDDGYEV